MLYAETSQASTPCRKGIGGSQELLGQPESGPVWWLMRNLLPYMAVDTGAARFLVSEATYTSLVRQASPKSPRSISSHIRWAEGVLGIMEVTMQHGSSQPNCLCSLWNKACCWDRVGHIRLTGYTQFTRMSYNDIISDTVQTPSSSNGN